MKKCLDALDGMFHCLSALAFVLVGVCVLVQVTTRYTPGISTPWTDEMTRMFFLYAVMLASPMALKYREYAAIDIFTGNLGKTAAHIQRLLILALTIVVMIAGAWQALAFFKVGRRIVTTSLAINMGFFYVVPLGIFALTFLYCLVGIAGEAAAPGKREE
jgi:TRAP-type C4-dicarboxylate transport system permease small subunit